MVETVCVPNWILGILVAAAVGRRPARKIVDRLMERRGDGRGKGRDDPDPEENENAT